jgi:hypothetical protein
MIGLCPVCCVYVEITSTLLVFFPGAFLGGALVGFGGCVRGAFESHSFWEGEEGATVSSSRISTSLMVKGLLGL